MKTRNTKNIVANIVDWIFYLFYITLTLISLADILGILKLINANLIENIILITFSSIGIISINDKRIVQNKVLTIIKENQSELNKITDIDKEIKHINQILPFEKEFEYLSSKTDFYLHFTKILLNLENNSEILLTNFEKNFKVKYDKGEVDQIESFMKSWDKKVKNNELTVKHLLHITTTKDIYETSDRINKFKVHNNYNINLIVGMPIEPFIDFAIINEEIVLIGFPKDINSPNNISYGIKIQNKEFGRSMAKYFNIYYSKAYIIKSKDFIDYKLLKKIEQITINSTFSNPSKTELYMKLMKIEDISNSIEKIINQYIYLKNTPLYFPLKLHFENKINELTEFDEKILINENKILLVLNVLRKNSSKIKIVELYNSAFSKIIDKVFILPFEKDNKIYINDENSSIKTSFIIFDERVIIENIPAENLTYLSINKTDINEKLFLCENILF